LKKTLKMTVCKIPRLMTLPRVPALISLLSLIMLIHLPQAVTFAGTVEVDLATPTGPALHRGSGMLWGLSGNRPGDEYVDPLKFKVFRSRLTRWISRSGIESMERMSQKGARIHAVISDEYYLDQRTAGKVGGVTIYTNPNDYDPGGGFAYEPIEIWPGDVIRRDLIEELLPDDLSEEYIINREDGTYIDMYFLWDEVVEESFNRIQEAGLDVEWDFWEEPNWKGWFGPYGDDEPRNHQRYFEVYKRTYEQLKQLDPDAKIVGPSANRYHPAFLEPFLLYAKEHNVLPDSLSWHEIIEQHSPVSIPTHANNLRNFMAANDIHITQFDINEVVSDFRQTNAGLYVWYFTYLEEAQVTSACRAVWFEPDGTFNGWQPMLGGLLNPNLEPRSCWWVHKAYADITGTLLKVDQSSAMAGLAGINEFDGRLRILMGRGFANANPFRVRIRNTNAYPWLFAGGQVRVVAKKMLATGWDALAAPVDHFDTNLQVSNGQLDITLNDFYADEAMMIELIPLAGPDMDSDGDGLTNSRETGTGVYEDINNTGTYPFIADSDLDGLPDGKEVDVLGFNPNSKHSSASGFHDMLTYAFNLNGAANPKERMPAIVPVAGGFGYEIDETTAADLLYEIYCSHDLVTWYRIASKASGNPWQKDTVNDATPVYPHISTVNVESTANGVQVEVANPAEGESFLRTRVTLAP
jgi:hypothetical protein